MTVARWLILGSHIPPEGGLGGMIRYTVEVTRSLHRRADTEVHVHCRADVAPFLENDLGIPSSRIHGIASGSTVRDSLAERYSLHRLAADIGADVIFGSKQLIPRSSGGATRMLTVHDMLPFDRPADFGPAKRILLPAAYRQSVRNADVLACVSHAARDRLIHHIPDVGPRAEVVHNAMTSLLTEIDPEPIPELAGRRFAVMVGDRSARKNAGFVVELWPDVVARVPDAVLAMVGPPGWGRNVEIPELEALTKSGSIVELGRIGDAALRWAYQNAGATLCPSLLEGFGLPVLEALTLGCPPIISADPAQVEAAAGAATIIDVADRAAWIDSIVAHLTEAPPPPARPSGRSWDDVAADLVASLARSSLGTSPLVDQDG